MDGIFCGNIACGTLDEWTTTQTSRAGVKGSHSRQVASVHIRKPESTRVMQVKGNG